jgi:hypothetical protein
MNKERCKEMLGQFSQSFPNKRVDGRYRIEGNSLIYASAPMTYGEREINTIAIKLPSGSVIGNASILPMIGRTSAWGNISDNRNQTLIQTVMQEQGMQMIPFSIFEENNLDISSYMTIEAGPEEQVKRLVANPEFGKAGSEYGHEDNRVYEKMLDEEERAYRPVRWQRKSDGVEIPQQILEEQHFVGAQLFSVGGNPYLFDIDRVEIENGIFNAFFVAIPKPDVKTIAEAYECLKPQAVVDYEAGYALENYDALPVKRQGEWFFIPSDDPTVEQEVETVEKVYTQQEKTDFALKIAYNSSTYTERERLSDMLGDAELERISAIKLPVTKDNSLLADQVKPLELRAGRNRPNNASEGFQREGVDGVQETFVKGSITHSGREHKELILETWHKVVASTAIASFQISGDID